MLVLLSEQLHVSARVTLNPDILGLISVLYRITTLSCPSAHSTSKYLASFLNKNVPLVFAEAIMSFLVVKTRLVSSAYQ